MLNMKTVVHDLDGKFWLVSTVDLPEFSPHPFETMVFRIKNPAKIIMDEVTDQMESDFRPHYTEAEAMEGHQVMVDKWTQHTRRKNA